MTSPVGPVSLPGRTTVVRRAGQREPGIGVADLWRRRELLLTLVERQVRLRTKRSVVGVAWPLLSPLFLFLLYDFVFRSVFDVPIADYGVFLFAGLVAWTYMVQAVHDSLQSISFEPDLVRRAPFPLHLLPISRVIVMTVPFLVLLAGFVIYLAAFSARGLDVALLPVLLVPITSLVLLVATVSLLLALLDVFNRDFRYVLNNVLTVWFFLTPIVYQRRMTSDRIAALTAMDPMRWIVEQFRDVLYDGQVGSPLAYALTLATCSAAFVGGMALFRHLAVDLAKEV